MKKLTVLLASIFFLLFVGLSDSYAEHKKNPKAGHGGGGGGDVLGNFTVTVYIKVGETFIDVGSAVNVVGDSESDEGHHRVGVGATDMKNVMLDNLDMAQLVDCPFLGAPDGRFGISTASHEENGEITFVSVAFHNFTSGGVSYWVAFDNGVLDDVTKWLPGPTLTSTWTGGAVNLGVTRGPTKKSPCNGIITQEWKVEVFNQL